MTRLVANPPKGLRERTRADGSVRLWWEPSSDARQRGHVAVELDATRLTWSVREAERLNRASLAGASRRTVGQTIDHLIDDFTASMRFGALADRTRRSYAANHRLIRAKWGAALVADFSKPVMNRWYEALFREAGQWQAVSLLRSMSILFAHAELAGWRPEGSNPCQRLRLKVPKGRRRVASWAEIDALIGTADRIGLSALGTACALSAFAGQRQTDIRLATRDGFAEVVMQLPGEARPSRQWVWQFERSKRGNSGAMVLHPEVAPRVAAIMARPGRPGDPLLTDDRNGRPWSEALITERFAELRAAAIRAGHASLHDFQFRDLRRTYGALSRAGGASKDDVGDVLGNSAATDPRLADIYMEPSLISTARATAAIRRPAKGRKQA